jgi:hypothetical protein
MASLSVSTLMWQQCCLRIEVAKNKFTFEWAMKYQNVANMLHLIRTDITNYRQDNID